jgi:hypothetical protein
MTATVDAVTGAGRGRRSVIAVADYSAARAARDEE